MTRTTFNIDQAVRNENAPGFARVAPGAGSSEVGGRPRTVPAFIRADEAYYWSFRWQADVQASMKALRDGDYVDFNSDDPSDIARWLLNVDEDDC
jgi:hypothetical protein